MRVCATSTIVGNRTRVPITIAVTIIVVIVIVIIVMMGGEEEGAWVQDTWCSLETWRERGMPWRA
jgi:hypothetical protein